MLRGEEGGGEKKRKEKQDKMEEEEKEEKEELFKVKRLRLQFSLCDFVVDDLINKR